VTAGRSVVRLALATLACAACRLTTDYAVHDTEGRDYRVACRGSVCAREVESPSSAPLRAPCAAGEHGAFVLAGRRVVVVCPACVGAGALRLEVERCRAVRCDADEECPPHASGQAPHCAHGLCEIAAHGELDFAATMGLCMAGAGPAGQENPREASDRAAIARAACPDPARCQPATACRAP
jgi:hypothetical protein